MRKSYGPLVNNLYGTAMVVVFCVNAICYGAVWMKIRKVGMRDPGPQAAGPHGKNRYLKTAQTLMVFVAAFAVQWAGFIVQAVWGMVGVPAMWLILFTVVLTNMGGVLNALAYTVIRRFRDAKKQAGTDTGNNGTSDTTNTHSTQDSYM